MVSVIANRFAAPLLGFLLLSALLYVGLGLNPRHIPSPFIDKPAPSFRLPVLDDPGQVLRPVDLQGKVWILNVWASWCVACREEHPLLVNLASRITAPIVGLDYKDAPEDAKRWLAHFGNPYQRVVVDRDGKAGIDWGVYGVPETFVIDAKGMIRYKHVGPLSADEVEDKLLSLVARLQGT